VKHQRLQPALDIRIRKLRRVLQPLLEPQARRFARHTVDEEIRTKGRVVHAGQHRAVQLEQFRQAAQHALVVLGQQEAAFLERRRVDDHQVVRALCRSPCPRI
jgi:hypothetical protein